MRDLSADVPTWCGVEPSRDVGWGLKLRPVTAPCPCGCGLAVAELGSAGVPTPQCAMDSLQSLLCANTGGICVTLSGVNARYALLVFYSHTNASSRSMTKENMLFPPLPAK